MSTAPATPSQRDHAYRALREALILQQVKEGQRLSEPTWARQIGVSRTAIREAFARLEAEGLIERAATAGYVVPVLDDEDIREIMDVRLALETAAIARACEKGRTEAEHLAPLIEAIEQQATFIEQNYRLGASEADRRFHDRLVELSGNRRLVQMYRRAPLPLIHRLLLPSAPPTMRPVHEHRAVVKAIAEADATRAQQQLKTHLQQAFKSVDAGSSHQE